MKKRNRNIAGRRDSVVRATEAVAELPVQAAGTSEGAIKGWEQKRGHAQEATSWAESQSRNAQEREPAKDSDRAYNKTAASHHSHAALAHGSAKYAHRDAQEAIKKEDSGGVNDHIARNHGMMAESHEAQETFHRKKQKELLMKASDATEDLAVHARHKALQEQPVQCRASGAPLAASAKWELDSPVSFQWLPGGTTTINAHFGDSSIELTVQCDEATAPVVQASYEGWLGRSRQEPFGCIEHAEREAAIRLPKGVGKFEWRNDPEQGIFCTALPTQLGVNNVNGRIHRSWSPSFTTDADYAQAKESGGCLTFPVGVRGSTTNPARVTGVAFSVGSLTNKPAFRNILPVRAKEAPAVVQAAEEVVRAAWGPEARAAALEARKAHSQLGEHLGNEASIAAMVANKTQGGHAHWMAANALHEAADHHAAAAQELGLHKEADKSEIAGHERKENYLRMAGRAHSQTAESMRDEKGLWKDSPGTKKHEQLAGHQEEARGQHAKFKAGIGFKAEPAAPDRSPPKRASEEKIGSTESTEPIDLSTAIRSAPLTLDEAIRASGESEEIVQAVWSDAARAAALEARKTHGHTWSQRDGLEESHFSKTGKTAFLNNDPEGGKYHATVIHSGGGSSNRATSKLSHPDKEALRDHVESVLRGGGKTDDKDLKHSFKPTRASELTLDDAIRNSILASQANPAPQLATNNAESTK